MNEILQLFADPAHAPIAEKVVLAVLVLSITAGLAHFLAKFMHRILRRDDVDLPANSILINLVRALVWFLGGAFVLSNCCGIDVNGLVTGLGVVGIAISLGFQGTLSDLISGVFISLNGVVSKGEYIRYGATEGVVLDVNWRQTIILDADDCTHIIPNSTISGGEVIHLPNPQLITISLLLPFTDSKEDLEAYLENLKQVSTEALKNVCELKADVVVVVNGTTYAGLDGLVKVWVDRGSVKPKAVIAAVGQAVAPYCSRLG